MGEEAGGASHAATGAAGLSGEQTEDGGPPAGPPGEAKPRGRWPVAAAAGVTVVAVIGVGAVRGASDVRQFPSEVSTANRSCTVGPGDGPEAPGIEVELRLTSVDDEVRLTRRTTAEVPSRWWEARALYGSWADTEQRARARYCLLGTSRGDERIEFNGAMARVAVTEDKVYLPRADPERDWCRSLNEPTIDGATLRFGGPTAEACAWMDGSAESPLPERDTVRTVVRVVRSEDITVRMTHAAHEDDGVALEWRWDSGIPDRLALEVPLSAEQHRTTVLANDSDVGVGPRGWHLRLTLATLLNWGAIVVTASAIAVALLLSSSHVGPGPVVMVVALAAAVVVGQAIRWEAPDRPYSFAFSVSTSIVLAAGAGAAACIGIPGRRLRAATVAVVTAATVAVVVIAAGTSTVADPFALRTEAITVAAMLFVVLAVFCSALATWALRGIDTILDGAERPRLVTLVTSALVVLPYCYALGWYLGYHRESGSATASLGRIVTALPYLPLAYVSALVVIVAVARIRVGWDPADVPWASAVAVGLVWGLVAGPASLFVLGRVIVPVGTLVLGLFMPFLLSHDGATDALDVDVDVGQLGESDVARRLLNHGPHGSWQENVWAMARIGAVLSVLPIGYSLWSILDLLPSRTTDLVGAAFVAGNLVEQALGWVVTAMVLGLLYNRLPGRIGPVRAASLATLWFAAAATGEIASRWFGADSGRSWAVPGLQLLLFMTVVSVVYDYRTLVAAGGGRAELELVYRIERTRDLLAVAAPALIAILAISQQVATGGGLESIQGIVENLPSIVPAGGR